MTIPELDKHIASYIQGGFGQGDMEVLKKEIEKLSPGDLHVQIGIDEGRSLRVAHEYAKLGVYIVGIDIHDPTNTPNLNRSQFMEQEGMVGLGKRCFYIHGDADELAKVWDRTIDLLFIDGHHGYEDVKRNHDMWIDLVRKGGVILFHDIDHPGVFEFLDKHYEGKWENTNGKIGKVICDN